MNKPNIASTICNLEDCNSSIADLFGVKCACGLCEDHCIKLCSADFECSCMDDLLDIRFDFEFKDETEMQEYAQRAKVVLTNHTKPIIDEGNQ